MTLPELLIFRCKEREACQVCMYTTEDVPFSWFELRELLIKLRAVRIVVGILESKRTYLFHCDATEGVEWEL